MTELTSTAVQIWTYLISAGWLQKIVAVVITSSFIQFMVNLYWTYKLDKAKRYDAAKFLATTIAFQLEGFAVSCSHKLAFHQLGEDSDGNAGDFISALPKFPPLPNSDAYQHLDGELLSELYDFPQFLALMRHNLSLFDDAVGEYEEHINQAKTDTEIAGHKAIEIAAGLRKHYKLPKRGPAFVEGTIVLMEAVAANKARAAKLQSIETSK